MGDSYNVDDILSEVRRKKNQRTGAEFTATQPIAKPTSGPGKPYVLSDDSEDSHGDDFVTQAIPSFKQAAAAPEQPKSDQVTKINISSKKSTKIPFPVEPTAEKPPLAADPELGQRRKERVSQFMGDISQVRERFHSEELPLDRIHQLDEEEDNPLRKFFGGMHKDTRRMVAEDEPDEDYMRFDPEEDDEAEEPAMGLLGKLRTKVKKPERIAQKQLEASIYDEMAEEPDEEEYNSPKDAQRVREEIWSMRNKILVRVVVTTLCFLVLFYLAVSNFTSLLPLPSLIFPETKMANFIMANLALLLISILSSATVIGNGLISLFTLQADQDTPTALAAIITFAHGIALAVNPNYITFGQGHFYFVAAALILMFNAIGSYLMIMRIWGNFKIASGTEQKRGIYVADEPDIAQEITAGQDLEQPVVAYTAPVSFPQGFLRISYDCSDGINKITTPLFLGFALVIAGISFFVFEASAMNALTYFTAMTLISCPLTSALMVNLPLMRAAKRLNPLGSYITGDESINEIEPANALVVESSDLYPGRYGVLYGIKPLDNTLIDQSITDMASVMCHINGSLKLALMNVISNDQSMLKVVEQVSYVEGKGMVVNIEGRTVLIGNRELLLHYGIDAPSRDYEFKLTKGLRSALYITNNDQPAAIFIVGYNPDPALIKTLKTLNKRGIALCVRSYDPNVTVEKIAEDYRYKAAYINIISSQALVPLGKLTAKRSKSKAFAMIGEDSQSLFSTFAMIYGLKRSITFGLVLQLVGLVLGYAAIAFLSFTGSITNMSFVHLVLYQLLWALMVGGVLFVG